MKNPSSVLGVTAIIGGTMIQICSLMLGNFSGFCAGAFGFYLVFSGLSAISSGFDATGRGSISMIRLAIIILLVGSLLDAIPGIGMLAPILYLIAFVIEILGFIKLKRSETLGSNGRKGVGHLISAMCIGVAFAIIDIFPLIGESIAGFTALFIIVLSYLGWKKIQEDMLQAQV